MPELLYRTSATMYGPWLVDRKELQALDELLDEQIERLNAIRKRELDKEMRRELNRIKASDTYQKITEEGQEKWEREVKDHVMRWSDKTREKREVTITCDTEAKLRVARLSEAFVHHESQNRNVTNLAVSVVCGEIEAKVEIPKYSYDDVDSHITPANRLESSEFFIRLEQWALGIALPRPIRIWKSLHPLQWTLVPLFFALFALFASVLLRNTGSKLEETRTEATQLVAKGITDGDRNHAMELALTLLCGRESGSGGIKVGGSLVVYLLICIAIIAVLSFPPKTAFSIGRGTASVNRQRRWIRFVSVIVPAFILMGVVSSTLGSAIYEWIKHMCAL